MDVKEMTESVLEFLEDPAISQITNARLPGQPPDYNTQFSEVSSVGLKTLRSSGARLVVDLENVFTKYKSITELRLVFDCGEDLPR